MQQAVQVSTARGSWSSLGRISSIAWKRLNATWLRLDVFDRLGVAGIASEGGSILKTYDAQYGEVLASDKLRLLMLDETSEEWGLYSETERRELLFHIFRRRARPKTHAHTHTRRQQSRIRDLRSLGGDSGAKQTQPCAFRLVIGGGLNQYDDTLAPYIETSKAIYRDLVSVQKRGATSEPEIRSVALSISSVRSDGAPLFPRESPHNFCYLTIDPLQRNVKLWYSSFWPVY